MTTNFQQRLERLVRAGHRCVRVVTTEEADALGSVVAAAVNTGRSVWLWSSVCGVYDGLLGQPRPVDNTENAAAGLYHLSRLGGPALLVTLDVAAHLRDERTLRAWRELLARAAPAGSTVVMIDHDDNVSPVVSSESTLLEFPLPGDEELERVVRETVRSAHRDRPVVAELSRSDLGALVRNLRGLTRRQAERVVTECIIDDRRLCIADLQTVFDAKRRAVQTSGLLEFVDSPVQLDQIGGMARLKKWLTHRAASFSAEADAFGLSLPRGVLLLGVQGAGKSLCAKAVAAAFRRPLLRMDVGALYDRFIGESERRLREALRQCESMAPIVLWIDEIEKAFASAASHSTDGGLSRRMFGALLTWLQEHKQPVFLVATANDIEALPPELLRKGRFDEIFFVDLPSAEARRQITRIHLSKRNRDPARFDLDRLVAASEGHSGAEIEAAIVSGLHRAFAEGRELTTEDVAASMAESPPLSVTMAESVQALREWAENRCVPAD